LIKTIDSIKNQTFNNYEVLIIDGESSEETQQYLSSLKLPFFTVSEKDLGIYDAMNKGIFLSKGEWLYFLGVEDVFFNEGVLKDIFENPKIKSTNLISGKISYIGVVNPFVYSKNKLIKNPSWSCFMWLRNGLHHQGTFYKKDLFSHLNYPLKYKTLADYWFNLYLYKRKEKCLLIDKTITICTSDGVSKTGSWSLYQQEINLKTALSSFLVSPFFYIIAFIKFLSRKIVND
jgi:putative colanic acid biosynthesis glycosyltransferase